MATEKEETTLLIDKEVLDWLREQENYERLINKILRNFYELNREKNEHSP